VCTELAARSRNDLFLLVFVILGKPLEITKELLDVLVVDLEDGKYFGFAAAASAFRA
jgi:hypothetical protein